MNSNEYEQGDLFAEPDTPETTSLLDLSLAERIKFIGRVADKKGMVERVQWSGHVQAEREQDQATHPGHHNPAA